jgi:beta-glucosidase-like glycosyl hydrolase
LTSLRPQRETGGQWGLLGSEHRALAREAVAKSLVLLKNKRRADQAFGAHSGGGRAAMILRRLRAAGRSPGRAVAI